MPSLAYKQPALQRNKPMDYATKQKAQQGSSMKKKSAPKKKKQGFAGPSTTSMTDLKEYAPTLYDEIKALEKELKVDID